MGTLSLVLRLWDDAEEPEFDRIDLGKMQAPPAVLAETFRALATMMDEVNVDDGYVALAKFREQMADVVSHEKNLYTAGTNYYGKAVIESFGKILAATESSKTTPEL